MTTPLFSRERALLQDWGFKSATAALSTMVAALEGVYPDTPALRFTDKAGYLAARAVWRARQRAIEAEIRALKAARRVREGQAQAQANLHDWSRLAHAALLERGLQQQKAGQQWAADRRVAA